jgi:uncharacterized protein
MHSDIDNFVFFNTYSNNKYLYDSSSNFVIPSPEPMEDIIRAYKNHNRSDIISSLSSKYRKDICIKYYRIVDNLFKENKTNYIPDQSPVFEFSETNYWKDNYENREKHQIILNVTEYCNLSCNYCVFSGKYYYYNKRNNINMSYEIAKGSIDYYFNTCIDLRKIKYLPTLIAISFYGGEPLLNFLLIKKVVNYCNNRYKYKYENIKYNITTNGSLFNNDNIEYFAKNAIYLSISLDGPREEHDRNRIYKNHMGSYDHVISNLKAIYKKYPEYFLNNVNIICTVDWKSNLGNIDDYFMENSYWLKLSRVNKVSQNNTTYFDKYDLEDKEKYYADLNRLWNKYYSYKTGKETESSILYKLFFEDEMNLYLKRYFTRKTSFTGKCKIGRRIFVGTDGRFHICEKMTDKFSIGDYKNGLCCKKIKKIEQRYFNEVIIKNNCHLCVARYFCHVCFANAGGIKFEAEDMCKYIKINIKNNLRKYYSLFESNRQILKEDKNSKCLLDWT